MSGSACDRRAPPRAGIAGPAATAFALLVLSSPGGARAQTGGCELGAIPGRPELQVLRCGPELTVTAEVASDVIVARAGGSDQLSATVKSGPALFEFRASSRQPGFQILTPHAVAAVRGTTWAVDVGSATTALFVAEGAVAVDDVNRSGGVVLRRGQGVEAGGGQRLTPERWSKARVRALLSRLGR